MHDACGSYVNSSLTGAALTRALELCLNESIWHEYGLQAKVSALLYCDSFDESDDITALDWTVMAIFIIIVMVNLVASFYDYTVNYLSEKDHVVGKRKI